MLKHPHSYCVSPTQVTSIDHLSGSCWGSTHTHTHTHTHIWNIGISVNFNSFFAAYIRSNQIMGWGEKAIEIRSVETGHLDGVFMHKRAQRLKFLCERNDKVRPPCGHSTTHADLICRISQSSVITEWLNLRPGFLLIWSCSQLLAVYRKQQLHIKSLNHPQLKKKCF